MCIKKTETIKGFSLFSNACIENNAYANMTEAQTHVTAQEVNQELLPGQ